MMTGAPRLTRTASVESRSETISRLRGIANLEQRFADGHNSRALAQPLQHDAIDRRDHRDESCPRLDGFNRARASWSSCSARATANSAARTASSALRNVVCAASSSSPEMAPAFKSDSSRATVDCARVRMAVAALLLGLCLTDRGAGCLDSGGELRLRADVDERRGARA